MNILNILRKKYEKAVEQRDEEIRERKQYNNPVDIRLIAEVERLAAMFQTTHYIIVEHSLEMAFFYFQRILRNPRKREALQRHFVNDHLLDSGLDDSEEILRMGEERYSSELLSLARSVVRNLTTLKKAMTIAKRTGNTTEYLDCQKKLENSVLRLAFWLETYPLDKVSNEELQESQHETESTD